MQVDYGNAGVPTTLAAHISGAAVFAGGSQDLTRTVLTANGYERLHLYPATGAMPGQSFTLRVTLAGLELDRGGAVGQSQFLPLILRRVSLRPAATPTPSRTPTVSARIY